MLAQELGARTDLGLGRRMPAATRLARLKGKPESQLRLKRGQCGSSLPESGRPFVPVVIRKVGVVKNIEHLPQQFDVLGVVQKKLLRNAKICLEVPFPSQRIEANTLRTIVALEVQISIQTRCVVIGRTTVRRDDRRHIQKNQIQARTIT